MWNDVDALRSIASRLQGLADSVGQSANDAQTSDPGWVSTAADGYRSQVDQAASALRTRSQDIRDASVAVFAYATTVEDHIGDLRLLASALDLSMDYVWGRLQDGVSDVTGLLQTGASTLRDGADDVLGDVGRTASAPFRTVKGWLS